MSFVLVAVPADATTEKVMEKVVLLEKQVQVLVRKTMAAAVELATEEAVAEEVHTPVMRTLGAAVAAAAVT